MLVAIKTGIQRYATSLILSIAEALPENPDLELLLYFHLGDQNSDESLLSTYIPRLSTAQIQTWHFPRGYRVILPIMAAVDRLDVLHIPGTNMPHFSLGTTVATIHDLCGLRLSPEVAAGERTVSMPMVSRSIQNASALIAVSQSTRNDLIEEYGVAPDRISLVHEGVAAQYCLEAANVEGICSKYGLDRYVLYVSTLQRRKNHVRLLKAFAKLITDHQLKHTLVLVGSEGWGHEEVYSAVESSGLDGHVRILGYVPDDELPGLYVGADLLVYPSVCEGFGLPVLEAMASGIPVVVANGSSLPEIAGDAGFYFDPLSVDDMAKAMYEVLTNSRLSAQMRQRGLNRVNRFTWQESAHKTIAVYRSLTGEAIQ